MSLTEIPVSRLRVSFEIDSQDAEALNFLHKTVAHANGRFDLKLTAFAAAPYPEPAPSPHPEPAPFPHPEPAPFPHPEPVEGELVEEKPPAPDCSRLIAPAFLPQVPPLVELLHIDRQFARARHAGADLAAAAVHRAEAVLSLQRVHLASAFPAEPAPPPKAPEAFDDDKLEPIYHGPIPPAEAAPTIPPSQAKLPSEPKSRAEALKQVAEAAASIVKGPPLIQPADTIAKAPPPKAPLVGKTVPVDPPRAAAPESKPTLNSRLIAKLRALYRQGDPIPGNKELGAELGASTQAIGVALAQLRKIEAIDYEWRPSPTLEDQTLQRRFVTKA